MEEKQIQKTRIWVSDEGDVEIEVPVTSYDPLAECPKMVFP
jgi:hypothetical protein